MTDEEREALAWLDQTTAGFTSAEGVNHAHRATLKAMLARPVLPEEPTREIVVLMHAAVNYEVYGDKMADAYRALYAHLTAPRTKTVWEVVAFEADAGAQVDSISEALRSAQLLLQNGHAVTIGKREVPV